MYEDDSGYELNDPKHPTYHDRMSSLADERCKFPSIIVDPNAKTAVPASDAKSDRNDEASDA